MADTNIVSKTIVKTVKSYEPLGPYSQAILFDDGKTLYVSGVKGLNKHGQMVCGDAVDQTRQALYNLQNVLEAGGASLQSVIKTTLLLSDMQTFKAVNAVYSEVFNVNPPTRTTFQAKLQMDAAVEIECIAVAGQIVVAEAELCPCSKI